MKITDVRARVLAAKPEQAVVFAPGAYEEFTLVMVELVTDAGIVGHGEAIARRGPEMTRAAVESLLASVLLGADARNIEGRWVEMMNQLRRWGHAAGVVVEEAISGVDCALWDIAGKAAGVPVWRLLHGAGREQIPCCASSVYIADFETMCAQAVEQVQAGFHAVRVKIGRSAADGGHRGDVESVRQIRAAVGDQVEVMVDANSAYDAATAIRVARGLEPFDVEWFEEPVTPDDLAGYERVHQMTSVPIAAGESVFGSLGFRDLNARRLIDVVQPDLGRCGGLTAARQIGSLCYAFAPHTGFSGGLSQLAAIHAAAAAPALKSLEYMFIDNPARELFVGGYPRPEGGLLAAPSGPGLGLDLDMDVVEAHTR